MLCVRWISDSSQYYLPRASFQSPRNGIRCVPMPVAGLTHPGTKRVVLLTAPRAAPPGSTHPRWAAAPGPTPCAAPAANISAARLAPRATAWRAAATTRATTARPPTAPWSSTARRAKAGRRCPCPAPSKTVRCASSPLGARARAQTSMMSCPSARTGASFFFARNFLTHATPSNRHRPIPFCSSLDWRQPIAGYDPARGRQSVGHCARPTRALGRGWRRGGDHG